MSNFSTVTQQILAARARYPSLVFQELKRTALEGESEAKALATSRLRVRSGYLRRSILGTVGQAAGGLELKFRAGGGAKDVEYAAAQEYGGVIRPTKGKYLAIPVGPALTPSGVPRYNSPRDVPGLAFAQSLKGQPMLVKSEGRGKKGAGTVYFLLRPSVTLTGKHFLRDGVEKATSGLSGRLEKIIADTLRAP